MNFHPNLIPVDCDGPEDLRKLAETMKSAAKSDPDRIEGYQASASEKEAFDKVRDSGLLRFARFPDGRIANIVCTLLETAERKQWNLSTSHATPFGPERVEDDLAKMICEAFLGEGYCEAFLDEGYQEVPSKAVCQNIRYFVKEYEGD